jgi:hypothetical protein
MITETELSLVHTLCNVALLTVYVHVNNEIMNSFTLLVKT